MKKNLLTFCLAVVLLLASALPAMAAEKSVLQSVEALGIMSNSQNLSGEVSRAEFAVMLTAASSYKDTISSEGSGYSLFKDVKSDYWASEYIRLAIQEGWLSGYIDRTFRPEQAVTLEEACSALLKLLGYDTASLAGSFPQAQLNKAAALGLRDEVTASAGSALSGRDCAYLFYNLMTAETASGQVYATTLGYKLTNGDVDYTAATLDNVSGPFVAENATPALSFTPETIYRNGDISGSAAIAQYDVYYYNAGLKTLWIYTDRISGKIDALSPSSTAPTSVTVAGVNYTIGSSTAAYKLSVLGGGDVGNIVTLLLGMDGEVVDVLDSNSLTMSYYGVVQSSNRNANTEDDAAVQTNVAVICTDGVARTFSVDEDLSYSTGQLVSVRVSGSEVNIKSLGEKSLSGKVGKNGDKLGDKRLATDIEILDSTKEGDAVAVEPERLAGQTLSSTEVRYYALDANGDIDYLILNNATGDIWSYGIMTDIKNMAQGESGSINMQYTYVMNGASQTINSKSKYSIERGGVAIRYNSDGSIKQMKNTKSVNLTELGLLTASANNKTYMLADNVQVYLKQNSAYYAADLASINTEKYNLVGYYDDFECSAGGLIRVITAESKE